MRNSIFYISVGLIGLIAILGIYVVIRTINQVNAQPKDFSLYLQETTSLTPLQAPSEPLSEAEPTLPNYQTGEVIIVVRAPRTHRARQAPTAH